MARRFVSACVNDITSWILPMAFFTISLRMLKRWLFLLVLLDSSPLLAMPDVVVSIKPLHSIVASLMQGVAEPHLLIEGSQSPHTFHLVPSQVRMLVNADRVIWIGEALEIALSNVLQANVEPDKSLALLDVPEVGGNVISQQEHQHPGDQHDIDPHLWLSPDWIRSVINYLAEELVRLDHEHASSYRTNAQQILQRIDELDRLIRSKLLPVRNEPYLVFHDAYGYFESYYGLQNVGAVTLTPEQIPGVRQVHNLQQRITSGNIQCLFMEPQFEPRLAHVLLQGTSVRMGILDPLGANIEAGPEAYFQLMHNLADAYATCLGDG